MKLLSNSKFKIILVGMLSCTFSHAITYPLTPLSDLGVQLKKTKIGARQTYELFDQKNKHTLVYQYNAEHMLESLEIKDAFGKSLEKTRFLPNRIWKQTPSRLDEWITLSRNKGIHRTTELSGKKRVLETPYEQSLEYSCSENDDKDKDIKQALSVVKDLDPEITNHLGSAKVKTDNCETYPGAESGLLKDMQAALKDGTRCLTGKSMDGITAKESNDQGTALLGIFQNPDTTVNLVCAKTGEPVKIANQDVSALKKDTLGRAWISPNEGSPGIAINLSRMGDVSKNERRGMLFHEMLHWLGILHTESFDTPYIASQCCMADDPDSPRAQKACELLNTSPRPDVDSKKYLTDFTKMMLMDGRSIIPLRTVEASTLRKLKDQPRDLSAQYEATKLMKDFGDNSADVYAYSLKKMDPNLKDAIDPKAPAETKTAYDQAVALTGDLVYSEQMSKKTDAERANDFAQLKKGYQDLLDQPTTTDQDKVKIKAAIVRWSSFFPSLKSQYLTNEQDQQVTEALWTDATKDFK